MFPPSWRINGQNSSSRGLTAGSKALLSFLQRQESTFLYVMDPCLRRDDIGCARTKELGPAVKPRDDGGGASRDDGLTNNFDQRNDSPLKERYHV